MNAFERALSAEGLTVSTIHGKGRGLVAAKDFFPGDVIICQEPYASSPSKSSTGSSCDGCFSTTNLKKCSGCRIAWYCGSACQKSEWKLHQLECKALSFLTEDKRKMLTPTIRLMIRLVLRRKLQNDRVIQTTSTDNYDLVAALVSQLKEVAILEGYGCKDHKCFGFLFYITENKAFTCQICGHSRDEYDINMIANEVEELSAKAASSLSTGNLSEACLLYEKVEQLEVNLLHPHSVKLLGTRETLLKVSMELNDWRDALKYCQLTIPVYQRLYQSPHPLLGLQYYTCGKLEWLLEQTEDALKSFTKAVEILRITHGTSTPFMKELFSKLEEARAEYRYKLSAKDRLKD